MNEPNHTDIIEKASGGDSGAFGVLVEQYSGQMYALALRICGNREDAEEVTQDAFIKIHENLKKFRGESSFSSWAYRITYNTAISYIRKHKRTRYSELYNERVHSEENRGILPEEENGEALTRESNLLRLENAMEKLPPDDKVLILLFYREDKPVREIAGIMDLSENNVKTRLHRIRKRLGVIYENL